MKSAYSCLWLDTFGYLWLPLLTNCYLSMALLGLTGPFLHLSKGLTNRLTDWLLSQPKSWNIKIAMKLVQTFPPLNYIKRHFFNKLQQRWCKDPFIFIIVLISLLRGCFRHKSRWLAALAGLLPPGDDDTRDGRLMDSIKMAPVSPLVPQIDPSVKLYNHVVQSRRRPLLGPSPGWKRYRFHI